MQNITALQTAARANTETDTFEAFCAFIGNEWDEEVMVEGVRWMGLVRDEQGKLQVYAEFVFTNATEGTYWLL